VVETGFISSHPVSDGLILTGAHENGAHVRFGESVWRRVIGPELGGGGG
jgi:hypothetical protein